MTRRKGIDEALAPTFKALADPVRLEILALLSGQNGGGTTTSLQLGLSRELAQSSVAHHLRKLHDAGLLTRRKDGGCTYYAIAEPELRRVAYALGRLL